MNKKASPQLENGYTTIANEIMEVLPRTNISSQEYKILMVVFRKIYGWKNKKSDRISISQFKKATGIDDTSRISQLTNSLENKKILLINRTPGKTKEYKFNKDYSQWLGLSDEDIDTLTQVKGYTLNKLKENTLTAAKEHFNSTSSTKEICQKKDKLYTQKIKNIYDHWIEKCSDINNARLTKRLKKRIQTKLKKWQIDKIIQAIDHYAEIYNSDWYYSHNFTLFKFIKQSNGAPRFVIGLDQEYNGDLWKDYQNQRKDKAKQGYSLQQLNDLGIDLDLVGEQYFKYKKNKYYPSEKGRAIINEVVDGK